MRLIIWDFDGTLANTRPVIEAGMDHTLQVLGLDPGLRAQWLTTVGLPVDEGIERTFGHLGLDLRAVAEAYRSFKHLEHEHLISGFDGMTELLEELRGLGVPMAIASSKRGTPLRRQLKALGWEGYFDPLVTPDEVRLAKPDPESLFLILAAYRLRPEDAVMVGDTPYDLEMARRAGMPCVAVGHGFAGEADMAEYQPLGFAPDVPALRDILLAWSRP
jgi:HAD superfamily hydrolase (TIGR01509 family)